MKTDWKVWSQSVVRSLGSEEMGISYLVGKYVRMRLKEMVEILLLDNPSSITVNLEDYFTWSGLTTILPDSSSLVKMLTE